MGVKFQFLLKTRKGEEGWRLQDFISFQKRKLDLQNS